MSSAIVIFIIYCQSGRPISKSIDAHDARIDLATKKLLLGKACRALSPGGALIAYDPLIDDDRCVQLHALLSSLNMLIETAGGFEYTGTETTRTFRNVHVSPVIRC